MDKTPEERAQKRYAYHTDPAVAEALNLKALEISKSLPSFVIGSELAMHGCALLMEKEGKVSIIDPSSYTLTFIEEKKEPEEDLNIEDIVDNG